MKYILVNPEVLVSEIEQNSGFGKDGFMPRIIFGKAEPEFDFAHKIIRAASSKVNNESEEADLTLFLNIKIMELLLRWLEINLKNL